MVRSHLELIHLSKDFCMLLDIISVEVLKDYQLLLTFENGEVREFDMNRYLDLKPYTVLKNEPLFHRAKIENGTVVWPGEIDMAPENLYAESKFIKLINLDKSKLA